MKTDLKIIFSFLSPYKFQVTLIFLFLFIYSILETVSIGSFYPLINNALSGNKIDAAGGGKVLNLINRLVELLPIKESIVAAGVFLLVMVIGSNLFGFFAESFATWYRYKLFADFLDKVYYKILNNQYRYFIEKKQGDLLYIGMNASQAVGEMLLYFPKIGIELFRILTITALLFTVSEKITILAYGIISLFGLIVHYLSTKIIHPVAVDLQDAQSEITAVFSESIAGIRQIQTFNTFRYWLRRFMIQTDRGRFLSTKNMIFGIIPLKLIQILGVSSVVLAIIIIKLGNPNQFKMFLPIIGIYVVALQKLMPSVANIGHHWMGLKGLMPRLKTTHDTLIDRNYLIQEGKIDRLDFKERIELENVSFSFSPEKTILKDLCLKIPKGKTIAIVGESGSGKSTLADIILQLHKPKKGRLVVDDVNYTEFTLSEWRKHIGMVNQEAFIFHASAKENIKMGKEDATDAEIIQAAKIANADEFISKLSAGYDTVLGDRGVKLSGGQRQRIAIARAVIRNPQILILDEATSALDNISEKIVQEALKNAGKNRTNIIIAHRLSTIEHADKIVVLDNGTIVEEGSHQDLMMQKGHYFQLYQSQKKTEPSVSCQQ